MNTKKIITALAISAFTVTTFAQELPVATTAAPLVQEKTINLTSTSIVWVDTIDANTVSVRLSNQLGEISSTSEAKILEDVAVSEVTKDPDNAKKIHITLGSELQEATNYSIISVSEGLDSSIDFTFSKNEKEVKNTLVPSEGQVWIASLTFIDGKNIEVALNQDGTLPTYEFKVFKEISSVSMFADTTNLNIQLETPLLPSKDYILILNLRDKENKDIEVENSLYDFVSSEFTLPPVEEIILENEVPAVEEAPAENVENQITQPIEEVAMNVSQTPDTGAKTNVLLFATFILTLSIFLLRRKDFKM